MKRLFVVAAIFLLSVLFLGSSFAAELGFVDIHGFISQGYLDSDKNNYLANDSERGSFQFNEMGLNFSKELTDKLRLGLQFFARDLGDIGNDEIGLGWGFADYRWKDWGGLRVGKIKMPFGFYNETRDVDSLRTCIILPQSVYDEANRDTMVALQGAGLYGDVPIHWGTLSYQLQLGTINIDNDGGTAKIIQSLTGGLFQMDSMDVDDVYVGSLQWATPLEGLRLGVSTMNTSGMADLKNAVGATFVYNMQDITITVFSAEYTRGNLILAAEHSETGIESQIVNVSPMTTVDSGGYYGSASYRFTDLFEAGMYYSVQYKNLDDKDGALLVAQGLPDHGAWLKDLALTTRFDFSDYWVLKVEGHFMDGTNKLLPSENPAGVTKDWFMLAGKITFSF
jgi:hypothetical protein